MRRDHAPDDDTDLFADAAFLFKPHELPPRPKRVVNGAYGNARLARRDDLSDLLTATPGPDPLVFPGVTLLVEGTPDGGALHAVPSVPFALPADIRERHLLAVGTTGGGKTTRLLLPALGCDVASPGRAIVALDAKGGVLHPFLKSLARKMRPGCPVHCVNFKQPAAATVGWNPLARPLVRGRALEVAHAVCVSAYHGIPGGGGGNNEAFWLHSSVNLLSDVLLALADDPAADLSLARAKRIVDLDTSGLDSFATSHPLSRKFSERYPAITRVIDGSGGLTQQSVVADLAMRLELFGDEAVAAATRGTGIDLDAVIRNGEILVIDTPEANAQQLLPLTNLLVTRALAAVLNEAGKHPGGRLQNPCTLVLDEFGSACGRLPDFEHRLATLRSRGVTVLAAVQTASQLDHIYGKAADGILENFCTKVFLGGALSLADARRASEMSGQCTVASVSLTTTDGDTKRVNRTRTPVGRTVLLPDEVMRPPASAVLGYPATVYVPGRPPFFAYFPPAYDCRTLGPAMRER